MLPAGTIIRRRGEKGCRVDQLSVSLIKRVTIFSCDHYVQQIANLVDYLTLNTSDVEFHCIEEGHALFQVRHGLPCVLITRVAFPLD